MDPLLIAAVVLAALCLLILLAASAVAVGVWVYRTNTNPAACAKAEIEKALKDATVADQLRTQFKAVAAKLGYELDEAA